MVDDALERAARGAAHGDDDAFRAIVAATSERLVRLALRILGNREEAEDVVQEAYFLAHQALRAQRFTASSSVETWLYRIVTNTAIDAARRGKRYARLMRSLMDVVTRPEPNPDSAMELQQLAGWLHQLPKDQYAALVLYAVEGLSAAEVAAILECTEGAVEQRLVRARITLRQRLTSEPRGRYPVLTAFAVGGARS